MKIRIESDQLSAALAATVAHATSGKDDDYMRSVDVQIIDDHLILSASNGGTTGVARAVLMETSGELSRFALDRDDVATVRGLFSGKNKDLEVTVNAMMSTPSSPDDKPEVVHQVQIRELGALFGGREIRLTTPDYSKRDVEGLWHTIASGLRRKAPQLPRTAVEPKDVGLFRAASAAYGEPLSIEPADGFGSLLVQCGQNFIGFLHADARDNPALTHARDSWRNTLPLKMRMADTGS
jgi:hypothetical protein